VKIIDKASWQLDGGASEHWVRNHFKTVFEWLYGKKWLTPDGVEIVDEWLYSDASLSERTVGQQGLSFLEECYDEYVTRVTVANNDGAQVLEEVYREYKARK